MPLLGNGPKKITMTRDSEGYREYRVEFIVYTVPGEGPNTALFCPGLPLIGSRYAIGSDLDIWCWCRWDAQVTPMPPDVDGWPRQYTIGLLFANKPLAPAKNRCTDFPINDPIQQPPKISGSSQKYSEEAWFDRFGKKILTSSHEPVRGPQVEFDANRPQVKIQFNTLSYALVLAAQGMQDHVNNAPLWGWPRRCIKLSSAPFQRLYYGTCAVYYSLELEFDINPKTFDRYVADEGTKALHGQWNPITGEWDLLPLNPLEVRAAEAALPGSGAAVAVYGKASNPAHFSRFKDRFNETCNCILDGFGKPVVTLDPTEILTCPSCVDGAPRKWELFGLAEFFPDSIILEYTAGCDWRGTFAGFDEVNYIFTLAKVAANIVQEINPALNLTATDPWVAQVQRVDNGQIVGQWFMSSLSPLIVADATKVFACADANNMSAVKMLADDGESTLTFADSNLVVNNRKDMPSGVVLQPYTGTNPGIIKVEKYNEANFLSLGIPASLG